MTVELIYLIMNESKKIKYMYINKLQLSHLPFIIKSLRIRLYLY